ncbi:MlaE family ABC transporter permease [Marinospirillum sp.]|uniref:MlaE family ABC transporter permease n=1 Tax=Marinospirillum sp. TaxID=2183934 RepID=UPI003A8AD3FA
MEASAQGPQILIEPSGSVISGDWITAHLQQWLKLETRLSQLSGPVTLQCAQMDTNGAVVFLRLFGPQAENWPVGLTSEQQALLHSLHQRACPDEPAAPRLNPLARIGYNVMQLGHHAQQLLDFLGRLTLAGLQSLRHPSLIRWRLLLDVIQKDGLHAMPIIALLSFLLGAVVAYQGGLQLATYGANIFIVELVALTHLRELGPLIAAILVAGRSGSAYAAQLATMNMNQEIMALKSLGQDPFHWLVLPKLFGLLLVLPLLTILADLCGLLGGMLVAQMQLDVSPTVFWQRLGSQVDIQHFLVGLYKAPVFALIIVNVGCMQGMLAKGGSEAVGQRTTRSVVQAIFLVIIADALFSIIFSDLGW